MTAPSQFSWKEITVFFSLPLPLLEFLPPAPPLSLSRARATKRAYASSASMSAEMVMSSLLPVMRSYSDSTSAAAVSKWEVAS